MGLFSKRKKKKAEQIALEKENQVASQTSTQVKSEAQTLAEQEIAVISAAMMAASEQQVPQDAELLAVISAAIAATESATSSCGPDSPEVLAVISAAIAAYEGESARPYFAPYGYENAPSRRSFRKINRTAGMIPAWGVAGNREAIDARRF